MQRQLELKTCAACDDVRREDNAKFILIGVCTAGVTVRQKPALIKMSLFCGFVARQEGPFDLSFSLEAASFNRASSVSIEKVEIDHSIDLVLPFTFFIEENSFIKFSWWTDDENSKQTLSWDLDFAEDAVDLNPDQAQRLKQAFNLARANGDA